MCICTRALAHTHKHIFTLFNFGYYISQSIFQRDRRWFILLNIKLQAVAELSTNYFSHKHEHTLGALWKSTLPQIHSKLNKFFIELFPVPWVPLLRLLGEGHKILSWVFSNPVHEAILIVFPNFRPNVLKLEKN